jgi:hypothetical protein
LRAITSKMPAGPGRRHDDEREPNGRAMQRTQLVLHPITWATHPSCYLEDLYVAKPVRREVLVD